jgi:hypothetical protein
VKHGLGINTDIINRYIIIIISGCKVYSSYSLTKRKQYAIT